MSVQQLPSRPKRTGFQPHAVSKPPTSLALTLKHVQVHMHERSARRMRVQQPPSRPKRPRTRTHVAVTKQNNTNKTVLCTLAFGSWLNFYRNGLTVSMYGCYACFAIYGCGAVGKLAVLLSVLQLWKFWFFSYEKQLAWVWHGEVSML